MIPNIWILIASAFIPFLIASVWFHPKVFGGNNWAKIAGLTDAQINTPIKPYKLGLSVLLNFLLAFGIYNLAVHVSGVFGLVDANLELMNSGTSLAFLEEYGQKHRSFRHGMIHGLFPGLLSFILPVLGYAMIFERKSLKYLFVNLGFWLISMVLMGGVICKWGVVEL